MSTIRRSQAITLKSSRFGESSEILHVFTRELGLIRGMAKGKRRPRSSLAAALEPFTVSEIVFYFRVDRDIQFIKEAHVIEMFEGFRSSYHKALKGFEILKLLDNALPEHVPHEKVFDMTVKALRLLSETGSEGVLRAYKLKFLAFMGHRLNTRRCAVCRKPINGLHDGSVFFSPSDFGPLCRECYLRDGEKEVISITAETIKEIETLMGGYFDNLVDFEVSDKTVEIIDKCLTIAFDLPQEGKGITS